MQHNVHHLRVWPAFPFHSNSPRMLSFTVQQHHYADVYTVIVRKDNDEQRRRSIPGTGTPRRPAPALRRAAELPHEMEGSLAARDPLRDHAIDALRWWSSKAEKVAGALTFWFLGRVDLERDFGNHAQTCSSPGEARNRRMFVRSATRAPTLALQAPAALTKSEPRKAREPSGSRRIHH